MSVVRRMQDSTILPSKSQLPPSRVTITTRALNGESLRLCFIVLCVCMYIWYYRYQSLFLEYQPESTITTYQFH